MEAVTTDRVHTTEPICSTLSCINVQDEDEVLIEEVSKEKEDELLYGGDEDDVLSDDSLRLRVSDDEDIETTDVSVSIKVDAEDEKPKNVANESTFCVGDQSLEAETESKEAPYKDTVVGVADRTEKSDQGAGDVPEGDKSMNESARNRAMRGGAVGSPPSGMHPVPRMKGQEPRRRFPISPRPQPYHHPTDNRASYMRQRYMPANELYRPRAEHYWNDPAHYGSFGGSSSYKSGGRYGGNGHDTWTHMNQKKAKEAEKKTTTAKPSDVRPENNASPEVTVKPEVKQEAEEEVRAVDNEAAVTTAEIDNSASASKGTEDAGTDKVKPDVCEGPGNQETPKDSNLESNSEIVCAEKNVDDSNSSKTCVDIVNENSEKGSENSSDGSAEKGGEHRSEKSSEEVGEKGNEKSLEEVAKDGELASSVSEIVVNDVEESPAQLRDHCIEEIKTNDEKEEFGTKMETSVENALESNDIQEDSVKDKNGENSPEDVEDSKQDAKTCSDNVESNENKGVENCQMTEEKTVNEPGVLNDQEKAKSTNDSEEVCETNEASTIPACNGDVASVESAILCNAEKRKVGCLEKLLTEDIEKYLPAKKIAKSSNSVVPNKSAAGKNARSNEDQPTKETEQKSKIVNIDSDTTDNPTSADDSSSTKRGKSSVAGDVLSSETEKKTIDDLAIAQRRRRRSRRITIATQEAAINEALQENGRQKRKTAKNAAEIIRKRFLNHDSDLESSDGSEKFVKVNPKVQTKENARSLSPPSLKRSSSEMKNAVMNGVVKKPKIHGSSNEVEMLHGEVEKIKSLTYARKFFQRDAKGRIEKLKQEEFEEILIQMIAEVITNRSEMGRLREQARVSMRNQEALRTRCQQLAKQIKDLEMVLSRNAADRQANNNKPTAPIKINRSVGLQVNIVSPEYGTQNLRQIQNNTGSKTMSATNTANTPGNESNSAATNPRRGLKVRSPRKSEQSLLVPQSPSVTQSTAPSPAQSSPLISTVTPAALVVSKSPESSHNLTLPPQTNNVSKALPVQQSPQQQQSVIMNGKIPNQPNRQSVSVTHVKTNNTSDLIDLTDEEEKSKTTVPTTKVATPGSEKPITVLPKAQTHAKPQTTSPQQPQTQACYQRVIQAIPANVAISSQPNIRVVQPTVQPTPTALVNNMNAPRVAYVMQSGGPARQLLITSNSNNQMQIRPVTSCRPPFTTVTYKTGIQTIANGTVRVLTTSATPNVQVNKHPAPLPDTPNYTLNPAWKLPPPAPSLKIVKQASEKGIVLSWNMALSDKYAQIVSYQLYAYQEIAGVAPSTALWKKVGDVRALPLPMACTLTQFSEGNNYYFAVRAVDTHSRKGQYSAPGNISL